MTGPPKPSLLLTGANGGLGLGFVSNLLASPYTSTHHVLYTVRSTSSILPLKSFIESKAQKNHSYEIIVLDLVSLLKVREVCTDINTRVKAGILGELAVLVLNAAWQEANEKTKSPQTFTEEGYEANFGINYLSQFLLVLLLLQSIEKSHGRIVQVGSHAHDSFDSRMEDMGVYDLAKKSGRDYTVMFRSVEEWKKGVVYQDDGYKAGMRRYGASKLAGMLFMHELQRRLSSPKNPELNNISILTIDPGAMGGTSLTRSSPLIVRALVFILWVIAPVVVYLNPNGTYRTTKKSGHDLLLASFEQGQPWGERPKVMYLSGTQVLEGSVESRNKGKQMELWEGSVKLAGLSEGDTVLEEWK